MAAKGILVGLQTFAKTLTFAVVHNITDALVSVYVNQVIHNHLHGLVTIHHHTWDAGHSIFHTDHGQVLVAGAKFFHILVGNVFANRAVHKHNPIQAFTGGQFV